MDIKIAMQETSTYIFTDAWNSKASKAAYKPNKSGDVAGGGVRLSPAPTAVPPAIRLACSRLDNYFF